MITRRRPPRRWSRLAKVLATWIGARGGNPVEGGTNWLAGLDAAGYIATLATNSEFEIYRYLRLGEVVTSTMEIESVSEEKQTRIGRGFFITWVTTYRVEGGEVVGRQMFRILKFAPDLSALS